MTSPKQVETVKTTEQRYATKKWDRMFVSRHLIQSQAFQSLRTATACKVYLVFLTKCQMKKPENKPKDRREFYIANNGRIQFSYREAKNKWSITPPAFTRAIDELVEKGLIDIAETGSGIRREATHYGISARWEKYGTPEFIPMRRTKRKANYGFAKGNKCGRNSRAKIVRLQGA